MIIKFYDKQDVGIEFITNVIQDDTKHNIYKYKDEICEYYFNTNLDYIGYINYDYEIRNDILNIVKLIDKDFDEKVKKDIINENPNIGRGTLREIYNVFDKLNHIIPIERFRIFPPECETTIDLHSARKEIETLNGLLNCKNFKISINYVFNMEPDTEINAHNIDSNNLLLCIFDEKKCVSSLIVNYSYKNIKIDSKTKQQYEGNKLNKLLRAVIIIISKSLYSEAQYVKSQAINPTSAYLMINNFNAKIVDFDGNPLNLVFNDYEEMKKYIDQNEDGIITKVELNEDNINKAREVFNNIVDHEIKCEKNKSFKVDIFASVKSSRKRRRTQTKSSSLYKLRKSAYRHSASLKNTKKVKNNLPFKSLRKSEKRVP
jgi:hypothetical protein